MRWTLLLERPIACPSSRTPTSLVCVPRYSKITCARSTELTFDSPRGFAGALLTSPELMATVPSTRPSIAGHVVIGTEKTRCRKASTAIESGTKRLRDKASPSQRPVPGSETPCSLEAALLLVAQREIDVGGDLARLDLDVVVRGRDAETGRNARHRHDIRRQGVGHGHVVYRVRSIRPSGRAWAVVDRDRDPGYGRSRGGRDLARDGPVVAWRGGRILASTQQQHEAEGQHHS